MSEIPDPGQFGRDIVRESQVSRDPTPPTTAEQLREKEAIERILRLTVKTQEDSIKALIEREDAYKRQISALRDQVAIQQSHIAVLQGHRDWLQKNAGYGEVSAD